MENPEILWAQNRDKIFITLNVSNISEQNIEMTADLVHFQGRNEDKKYNVEINLLKTIEPDESSWSIKPNCVNFTLKKLPEVFWSKLSSKKFNNIRVDWNKWDIMEESDESDDLMYDQENLYNNFKDFTKTLPSDLMEKDFKELFPNDISSELSDEENTSESVSQSDTNFETLNVENLDIGKLDEELMSKMEEGRITRKDRESLTADDEEEIKENNIESIAEDVVDEIINNVVENINSDN